MDAMRVAGVDMQAMFLGKSLALAAQLFVLEVVLFAVAFLGAVAVMLATGSVGNLAQVPAQPRHLLLGGLLVCFYVLSVTWVAPRFGLGNAITCVLLGQLVSASLIDHFGLFGAILRQMTPLRLAGLALMAVGVILTQKG